MNRLVLLLVSLLVLVVAAPAAAVDYDADGFDAGDCAPLDPAVFPGAPDRPDLGFEDANCDGVDGDPGQAVFVATSGDDGGTGSLTTPLRTIAKGIAVAGAATPKKAVYVLGGTYEEKVKPLTGVRVYGGYTPSGARSSSAATTVKAPANSGESVLVDGQTGVELQLLTVIGPAQGGAGASSYAIRAIGGSTLALTGVTATGGTAGSGSAGGAGSSGANGTDGSCGGLYVGGGLPPFLECPGRNPTGGAGGPAGSGANKGGDGGDRQASTGEGGGSGTGTGAGGGGGGGTSVSTTACQVLDTCGDGGSGGGGAGGTPGSPGAGAAFTITGAGATWANGGFAGAGQANATAGAGGGGGGAGYTRPDSDCSSSPSGPGGAGGGGGGGGAPGTPGGGAGNGGGSFGVYVHDSSLTVDGGTVSGGPAGAGGKGGAGGAGGSGGASGPGADGRSSGSGAGCNVTGGDGGNGGAGGQGGRGGGGGGGAGGPSVGVFGAGTANYVVKPSATAAGGAAGQGGQEGNATTVSGAPGASDGARAQASANASTADFDGDGTNDADDACPAVPSGGAAGGCPARAPKLADADGDGLPDSVDACPTAAGGQNANGCPSIVANVDKDGDGFGVDQGDCDDTNSAIKPGAKEVVGNRIDENCDGVVAPYPRITAVVKTTVRPGSRSTAFRRLLITNVPSGAKVEIRCSPKRKCPFTRKTVNVAKQQANALTLIAKRKRKTGIVYKAGAIVEVRITAAERVGQVLRYQVRKRKRPKRAELCLAPGTSKPGKC